MICGDEPLKNQSLHLNSATSYLAARRDAALMDLSLKGDEDGLMLARWMRPEPHWRDVSIIATTAHAMAQVWANTP